MRYSCALVASSAALTGADATFAALTGAEAASAPFSGAIAASSAVECSLGAAVPLFVDGATNKMPSPLSPAVRNCCAAFHNNETADGSGEVKGRLAKFERGSAGAAAADEALNSDAMIAFCCFR